MKNSVSYFSSPLGPVRIEAGGEGIVSVGFAKASKSQKSAANPLLRSCVRQMKRYFEGSQAKFTVKLDLKGTSFQKKVWSELTKIPRGKAVSYRELAQRIGHPQAARAVGSAAGANRICILVPCHRLVASKGLGGYAYGIDKKKKLLNLEKARLLQ